MYSRYWCKKCEGFHDEKDPLYHEHAEHKINRYYCKECKHTHVASFGDLFESHLEHKGHEFEYFGKMCSYSVWKFTQYGVCIAPEHLKEIKEIFDKVNGLSWDSSRRKALYKQIDVLLHKNYDIINTNYSQCLDCKKWFEYPYFEKFMFCENCKPINVRRLFK